jgi:hypothetical protein
VKSAAREHFKLNLLLIYVTLHHSRASSESESPVGQVRQSRISNGLPRELPNWLELSP